jgi:hypothetical protein
MGKATGKMSVKIFSAPFGSFNYGCYFHAFICVYPCSSVVKRVSTESFRLRGTMQSAILILTERGHSCPQRSLQIEKPA